VVTTWVSGIGLFTHHKYRKSIESKVPLDAHGNPIAEVDEIVGPGDSGEYQLEERTGLTGETRGEDNE
jgi:solute carrier family 35, member C2